MGQKKPVTKDDPNRVIFPGFNPPKADFRGFKGAKPLCIEIIGTKSPKLIKELRRVLRSILLAKKSSARSLSVILVNNEYIRKLNRKYLMRNRVTDVLAFPFDEKFLGEIYICREQAKRQARVLGKTCNEEIIHLAKHGLMHLLGYPPEAD